MLMFLTHCEDVSGDSLVSALPQGGKGGGTGVLHGPVRAQYVGMSQARPAQYPMVALQAHGLTPSTLSPLPQVHIQT